MAETMKYRKGINKGHIRVLLIPKGAGLAEYFACNRLFSTRQGYGIAFANPEEMCVKGACFDHKHQLAKGVIVWKTKTGKGI